MEEEKSVENALKSVKNLINSPSNKLDSNDGVLELTEDDLYDELDEDYQDDGAISKIAKKNFSINQFLTSISNTNKIVDNSTKEDDSKVTRAPQERYISEKDAAESAANIRNIIKKMEIPIEADFASLNKNDSYSLEMLIMKRLEPHLQEWLEKNVNAIIKKELNEIISRQNKKDE